MDWIHILSLFDRCFGRINWLISNISNLREELLWQRMNNNYSLHTFYVVRASLIRNNLMKFGISFDRNRKWKNLLRQLSRKLWDFFIYQVRDISRFQISIIYLIPWNLRHIAVEIKIVRKLSKISLKFMYIIPTTSKMILHCLYGWRKTNSHKHHNCLYFDVWCNNIYKSCNPMQPWL